MCRMWAMPTKTLGLCRRLLGDLGSLVHSTAASTDRESGALSPIADRNMAPAAATPKKKAVREKA